MMVELHSTQHRSGLFVPLTNVKSGFQCLCISFTLSFGSEADLTGTGTLPSSQSDKTDTQEIFYNLLGGQTNQNDITGNGTLPSSQSDNTDTQEILYTLLGGLTNQNDVGLCYDWGWPEPYICTEYIRCFWQGNNQMYSRMRCIFTVLANPSYNK